MSLSVETYALSKKYTNDSISGISGTLAGKNCTIQSITEIEGGHRVTFQWTADDSTVRTSTMDVMDGVDGEVPAETLLEDTVGWTGKNKLKTGVGKSGSIGNGTWKINSDGSITVNATLSSLGIAPWRLATGGMNPSEVLGGSDIPKGTYRIVWLNANGQKNDNIRLQIFGTNGALNTGTEIANTHTTETVTIDDTYAYYYARVWINTGTINDTMYGMLVSADISDLTYEPYHESVEEVVEQIYADNGVLGAKNLIPFPYKDTAGTSNGVTYIYGSNHEIIANNKATSISWRTLMEDFSSLELNKRYILSGCPSGGSSSTYSVRVTYNDGTEKYYEDYGNGLEFTNTGNLVRIQVIVANGYTANNLTFYPMLRLASDPDDTYQPYAMTNGELTDAVNSTILSGILPQLHLNKLYGYDASSAINIDTIHKPLGYMIRVITTGSGLSGTVPSEIGNALLIIGFSSMVNNGVEFGAQIALGFGADKIAFRRAGYNASGGSWGAWKYITIS